MTDDEALLYAYRLNGTGGGEALAWEDLADGEAEDRWIHLHRQTDETRRWLVEQSGLDNFVIDALLAEESRPRCEVFPEGVLLDLRGVNLNPNSDPEDMVSLRLWIEPNRVISVRRRRLLAAQDLRDLIETGRGPRSTGELVARLSALLVARMSPVISDLDDQVDELETAVVATTARELRNRLGTLRRQTIALRRYIAPQREALGRLINEELPWMDQRIRMRLREAMDAVTRYLEDLDSARDRAAVVYEELSGRFAEQMNRTMYVLTLVASIMLPLGFLTGLLGINVSGIPGADYSWAFLIVCVFLALLATAQILIFRRLHWL